jgi:Spy/CpxP family protein refolding chaperone
MEKYFTKIRILTWLVIALIIFNISTIATVVWHARQFRHDSFMHHEKGWRMGPPEFAGHFLKEKLDLNAKQLEKFEMINRDFHNASKDIIDKMDGLRISMLDELKKDKPDTTILFENARKNGELHFALKKQMTLYYLKIKNICSPVQRDTLSKLFRFIGPPEPGAEMHGKKHRGRPEN